MAIQELNHLIPNFQKKINKGLPEKLSQFYAKVSKISWTLVYLLTECYVLFSLPFPFPLPQTLCFLSFLFISIPLLILSLFHSVIFPSFACPLFHSPFHPYNLRPSFRNLTSYLPAFNHNAYHSCYIHYPVPCVPFWLRSPCFHTLLTLPYRVRCSCPFLNCT